MTGGCRRRRGIGYGTMIEYRKQLSSIMITNLTTPDREIVSSYVTDDEKLNFLVLVMVFLGEQPRETEFRWIIISDFATWVNRVGEGANTRNTRRLTSRCHCSGNS